MLHFCTAPGILRRQLLLLRDDRIRAHVRAAVQMFVLGSGLLLTGCGLMRTSYHVVTAPVRLFTGHEEEPSQPATTTTTTTTTTGPVASDVAAPGQPIASPTPSPPQRQTVARRRSPSPTPKSVTEAKPSATSTPRPSPAGTEFPTAKPVPGKPGYVFDPFNPNGGYIDVSGYPPGSKVKDPATKKIFIVP
jgi:hypothetical protein